MKKCKLTDICTPKQWKTIPTSELMDSGYPVYGANGVIGYYRDYNHEKPTVTITCRGATCGNINLTIPQSYVTGNAMCLDNVDENVVVKYLYYAMQAFNFTKVISGSAQPQITRENLQKVEICVYSIEKQSMIVNHLEAVERLIHNRKMQLEKLYELVQSRFIELFGDMFLNSKGWPESRLDSVADIVSGITKGRKVKSVNVTEVPYMAVSNVKDGYIDWTTVKTIEATSQEIEQYRLMPDDVLMTEGGDPDKVGRGAIIKKPLDNCIHQNHIFRVRLDESVILPGFFAEYLQHQRSKRYFLGCAKQTTGIASINMKQLRALPVLVPQLSDQEQFVSFVTKVDKSKLSVLLLWKNHGYYLVI